MEPLILYENQTKDAVVLSLEQRDGLHRLVPDIRIEPTEGRSDAYNITPGSRIGIVSVPELVVEIRSKIPIERLVFLLSYSLGLARWGDPSIGVAPAESLLEALVSVFGFHLQRALRPGILQGYRSEEAALMSVRGRIRFDDQIRRRFGIVLPVEVRFDDFTTDITENRLLRAAVNLLRMLTIRSTSGGSRLRTYDHILEDGVLLVSFDRANVPTVQYTRLNERYRGAVEWARLILRLMSFETRHGKTQGAAVLFDMNRVFEDFVRVALREALAISSREFPSGAQCPPLYLDEARRIRLEPDLSIWTAGRCRFVGDVKYKAVDVAGVKHPDIYQLLAYVTATRLSTGLFVYAAGEGDMGAHRICYVDRDLHIRSLQLDGPIPSIRSEISTLATFIEELRARD